jgi:DNA-binding XRE family transcriptional regulator
MQNLNTNKIKGYRVMIGLTQAEMAKELNMGLRTYVIKEQDNSKFTVSELNDIVDVLVSHKLDVKIENLL